MIQMRSKLSDIAKQIVADSRCPACKGKGKRGRGKCRKCKGKGTTDADLYGRFSQGYDQGGRDARMNRLRDVVDEGDQTGQQVSRAFDHWFAVGYEFGARDAERCYQDSAATWEVYTKDMFC